MTQDNNKNKLEEFYQAYLDGNISRAKYEKLFDLIQNDENEHLLQSIIDDTIPGGVRRTNKDSIEPSDDLLPHPALGTRLRISRRSFYRLSIAASVLILVFATFYTLVDRKEEWIVHTTDFQETKDVTLPDGSLVILNANSVLKWKKGFEKEDVRVVNFTGEGYFDVSHLEGISFVVKTGSIDVNVLGTEFNLETRRQHTNVFLKKGKVVLKGRGIQPVQMVPGDLVHVDEVEKQVEKIGGQASASALSWRDGVFTFSDLTGIQILEKMEDIYGKEFIIEKPKLLEDVIVVQGLPYTDWDFTQEALELALNVQFIDSTSNRIIVRIK